MRFLCSLIFTAIGAMVFALAGSHWTGHWDDTVIGMVIAGVVGLIGLSEVAQGLLYGGALRTGRTVSFRASLSQGSTVWFARHVGARRIGVQLWAVNESPLFPGFDVRFVLRTVPPAPAEGGRTVLARSMPPWWIRSRHVRLHRRVLGDLVPGEQYEIGVGLTDAGPSEASLVVHSVQTLVLAWPAPRDDAD